ncbi:MAG: tetratricopeptide repeat protein [Candidatus Acidiferrales bacterium]
MDSRSPFRPAGGSIGCHDDALCAPLSAKGQSVNTDYSAASDAHFFLQNVVNEYRTTRVIATSVVGADVNKTFALAEQSAQRIPPRSSQQAEAYFAIALLEASASDLNGALSLLNGIDGIDADTRACLRAELLSVAHEDDKALQVSTHLNGSLRDQILVFVSLDQASRHKFAAAMATAAVIMSQTVRSDTLSKIAISQARAGDVQDAIHLTGGILPIDQSNAYSEIVKAQVKQNDLQSAAQTVSKVSISFELSDALSAIAAAYVRTGDISAALQTAGRAFRLEPNSDGEVTWAVVLRNICEAQANVGDITGAMQTASRLAAC